jgi:hypothetical protein
MNEDMPYVVTTLTIETTDSEFFHSVSGDNASSQEPTLFFNRRWLLDDSIWQTSRAVFHGKITFRRLEEIHTESKRTTPMPSREAVQDDGGPAFPQNDLSGYGMGPAEVGNGGISARDYFAGRAMQAIFEGPRGSTIGYCDSQWMTRVADKSYEMADAMLARRKR